MLTIQIQILLKHGQKPRHLTHIYFCHRILNEPDLTINQNLFEEGFVLGDDGLLDNSAV